MASSTPTGLAIVPHLQQELALPNLASMTTAQLLATFSGFNAAQAAALPAGLRGVFELATRGAADADFAARFDAALDHDEYDDREAAVLALMARYGGADGDAAANAARAAAFAEWCAAKGDWVAALLATEDEADDTLGGRCLFTDYFVRQPWVTPRLDAAALRSALFASKRGHGGVHIAGRLLLACDAVGRLLRERVVALFGAAAEARIRARIAAGYVANDGPELYGGEDFVYLFLGVDAARAFVAAERAGHKAAASALSDEAQDAHDAVANGACAERCAALAGAAARSPAFAGFATGFKRQAASARGRQLAARTRADKLRAQRVQPVALAAAGRPAVR
jgi:hypothetical protein